MLASSWQHSTPLGCPGAEELPQIFGCPRAGKENIIPPNAPSHTAPRVGLSGVLSHKAPRRSP
eukprot:1697499-Rhodomonas_salina.1